MDYTFTNNELGLNIKMPITSDGKNGKDEDSLRISRISSLLYQGKLRFYDKCKGCISDIQSAEYDQTQLEKGKIKILEVFNDEGHMDYLDCVSYAVSYSKNWLL